MDVYSWLDNILETVVQQAFRHTHCKRVVTFRRFRKRAKKVERQSSEGSLLRVLSGWATSRVGTGSGTSYGLSTLVTCGSSLASRLLIC